MWKRLPWRPTRSWRKNTGPRLSSLIAIAIAISSGETASRPSEAPNRSNARLNAAEERVRSKRLHAHHGDAVQVVELDRGADDLEQARQHADAHADGLQRADEVQHLAGVGAARRDDRAVHVERLGEVADLREAGLGEGVGRPRRDLVEVEVRDDLSP